MTKKELMQYRSIAAEIDELNERINNGTLCDSVSGSDAVYPFIKHTMTVSGMVCSDANVKLIARRQRLETQKQRIEDFIYGIPDSETRRIFEHRYMRGGRKPTWVKIARALSNGAVSPDGLRMIHDRYLKKT